MATQYFQSPESFTGKSLSQLRGELGDPFRADILAGMFGLQEQTPFAAGQTFGLNLNDPGSAEQQFISKYFQPGISPEQKAAQTFAQQQQATLQGAKTEAVGTLESGRDPLKQRYQDVIASIKGTAEQRRGEAATGASQEFARRGLLPSSGNFQQFLQQRQAPIDVAESSSLASTALSQTQEENAINSAIANIQQQTGLSGVQAALQVFQIGEQARQFGMTFEEGVRQFNESLQQEKELAQTETDPFAKYITVGEGQTLFDLETLQSLFKNPKTFEAGGGDDEY